MLLENNLTIYKILILNRERMLTVMNGFPIIQNSKTLIIFYFSKKKIEIFFSKFNFRNTVRKIMENIIK